MGESLWWLGRRILRQIEVGCWFVLTAVFTSCGVSEPSSCPAPARGIEGVFVPSSGYVSPAVNTDGRIMAYYEFETSILGLYDLSNGSEESFDLLEMENSLPLVGRFISQILFSPTDADKLLVVCTDYLDTGSSIIIRSNLYFFSVIAKKLLKVTPESEGKWGMENVHVQRLGVGNVDSIFLWAQGVYIPQTGLLIPQQVAEIYPHNQSKRYLEVLRTEQLRLLYGNVLVEVPKDDFQLEDVSWSEDGSKFALTVSFFDAEADAGLKQVWVYNALESTCKLDMVIDFWRQFCKFNFLGCDAEFVNATTLVVSMHADQEVSSRLWFLDLRTMSTRVLD